MQMTKGFRLAVVLSALLLLPTLGCQDKYTGHVENKKDPIVLRQVERRFNDTARFLAGLPQRPGSKLQKLTQTAYYKRYAQAVAREWNAFQPANMKKASAWAERTLPRDYHRTVCYPFAGPDMLPPLVFYPKANDILMFGLEYPGDIPNPATLPHKKALANLRTLSPALKFIFHHSFFVTRDMEKKIGTSSYSGVTGVMLFLLSRGGYQVLRVRHLRLTAAGKLLPGRAGKKDKRQVPALEIIFIKQGEKQLRRVRYVRCDIADYSAQRTFFTRLLQRYPRCSTIIKSASYLMHNDGFFSKIRTAVLKASDHILQDDSGIPYRSFSPKIWKIHYFGAYHKPLPVFKKYRQPALKEAVTRHSEGPLPFAYGYGYGYKDITYHLIFAVRK